MTSVPYNVDAEISTLCSTGLRPNLLTGVLLRLLTRHFSTAKGIQDPQLQSYIWSANALNTKILIVPVWKWLTPGSQLRPAIVIKRNALRPRQLGLGDGQSLISGTPRSDGVPINQPVKSQVAMAGSHTIFAISEEPGEAELLSTEVAIRLIQYQQAIQKEFGFNRFRVAEIGPLAKIEEATEDFAIPVTVAYMFIDAWSVWSAAPFLKRVVFETNV